MFKKWQKRAQISHSKPDKSSRKVDRELFFPIHHWLEREEQELLSQVRKAQKTHDDDHEKRMMIRVVMILFVITAMFYVTQLQAIEPVAPRLAVHCEQARGTWGET